MDSLWFAFGTSVYSLDIIKVVHPKTVVLNLFLVTDFFQKIIKLTNP